ncbi:hypothetical protein AXF42_Ash002121 [Apostasia shenzhenica]|uniref:Uncharacterized protein n=1 Tax=Apostasia shenzhenica TaxID=1088818 RepID=A0A2I0AML3_9ASPA|nr:hypothetical protein AXF42_Ash002121 [Apostasia shenzhenica]
MIKLIEIKFSLTFPSSSQLYTLLQSCSPQLPLPQAPDPQAQPQQQLLRWEVPSWSSSSFLPSATSTTDSTSSKVPSRRSSLTAPLMQSS